MRDEDLLAGSLFLEIKYLCIMTNKVDCNWYQNYEDLKSYIKERGHLPDKHVVENRALLSWAKYQRKKIKEGTLDEEKREMFESLLATRSNEHTGGRRPKASGI